MYPNLTPQRPLPGTYFPTPAPRPTQNGPLFPTTSPAAQPGQPATPGAPALSQSPLSKLPITASKNKAESLNPQERAARTINETLAQESRYPDLDSYLAPGFSSDYDIPASPSWAPFHKIKMYNIPDQIFEQYNLAQVSTSMGLFAELNHAWVTIDNALYLWDYTHPNPQLVGFESQPNSINAVKLAVPRPGVFLPSITHVLVISTTAEVLLMGLGCEKLPGGANSVTLYETGMSTSIRGLDINVIASSDSKGRVFFAGSTDNEVYELTYQQEEKWFQGRCGKINHTKPRMSAFAPSFSLTLAQKTSEHVEQMAVDDSRNLLYTLSSTSTIRVFHLDRDDHISLTITKAASEIYSNIWHIISSNEALNPKIKIVSISPIPVSEASRYHLMATTSTGYRIYLSATSSYNLLPGSSSNNAPTSMQAHHVKTPPVDPRSAEQMQQSLPGASYQASTGARVPIHTLNPTRSAQRFPPGYFFCFANKDPLNRVDTLFISTPDSGRIAKPHEGSIPPKIGESAIWLTLGSRAEDVGLCTPPASTGSSLGAFGNELAYQFDKPAAEIAILTNTGVHVVRRRRLVDVLAALVRNGGGDEGLEGEVKTFIRLFGRSETLATALAVACGQGVEVSSDSRLSIIKDPDVLEFARKVFIEFGGRPTMNENSVADNATSAIDTVLPSPRHAGIALYTSRLLRSIWKTEIAKENRTPAGGYSISPSVSISKLQTIQRDLSALQDFFRANRTFIEGLSGPEALSRASNKQEEIALQAEHRALHSLVQLVSNTIEGISFVLVLFDERVEEIVTLMSEESRGRFLKLSFEELFSSTKGHEVAKELVKAIVNRNIAKGSNVETVAEALRRRCGSFCSAEDVIIFKAQEQLKRAAEAGENSELGRNLLNESLTLFQQVAENLPMDYLEPAVNQYIANQFFAGAIQLSLSVAAKSDKANVTLSWIMDGRPAQDPRKANFDFRNQCYDLIYKVILAVDQLAARDPGMVDGQYTVTARRKNEAYDVISSSEDEVFLTSLYDWYLEQGWSDRLLEAKSPFVITYLERKSTDDIAHADLFWRYYSQANRFFEAAQVQLKLAQSAFSLSLGRRIEYLGQARANASTFTQDFGRQSRQRLLQEISSLMDVANIQDDLLQRLKEDPRITPEQKTEVLKEVDNAIMDLTVLFNKYADAGSYHDICLQIMHLADHRNSTDIKAMWQSLLQDVHEETVERGHPLPYEAVIEKFRSLGGRLRMSETTFPVPLLLPLLERYVLEHQRGVGPETWVIDLFLDLQVAHESIYSVMEALFYNDEPPFHGSNRQHIGRDLIYLIQRWFYDTVRVGGAVFGSDTLAARVSEMLLLLQQSNMGDEMTHVCQELRLKIEQVLR
ncbi:hypothetical protein FQN54_003008 [Arachnomyces sp. PD_36]|nr:hypothetical protein FQN54_003008 [Arachnomyces sp. PD_36]